MSASTLVRASRDGDQFHYLWAARRALQLLQTQSGLIAITVEGASSREFKPGEKVEAGEELIDIGEYFGSDAVEEATLVRYVQLKHSTLHANDPWQPSGLETTIRGFAKRYAGLREKLGAEALRTKLEFHFVTNRPIGTSFLEAVEDVASQRAPRHPDVLVKLKTFAALEDSILAEFCAMLHLNGREDDYWTQRNILTQEASGYLPALDVDAPTRLKELINRKALSESATSPAITKMDVLRALQTDEAELFPCPCMIGPIHDAVPRRQEKTLVDAIVAAEGRPVIVQADAGVGKSVFSTRIGSSLPAGSVSIVYDCFGNGQYRNASGYRHRHRTALVQIANELSAIGLCHPLIPALSADPSAYMRAFLHRLHQAISILRAQSADAVIAVIVDAADNAQMATDEIGERHSFIRDLIRETLPEGIRVIALSRPHRVKLLDPPPSTLNLVLEPFSRDETAAHLRHTFSNASAHDVDEFHRLSSHNPRLQAMALSRHVPLPETLRLLGPNPTTVDSAIGAILEESIVKLRDAAGHVERAQVDLICAGLAALRPLIPISVLASVSGVDPAAIKCFALDVGRPLVVNGDTIQFFDEPAETWFRDRFRPNAENLKDFISRLKPLSGGSAYVASALPQLMLEAGQFSELVELALTSSGLPEASPVERRDVELQRLQFALKAGLRTKRYLDSAKLALKAGGESAGDDRQRRLLQDNVDLVSLFMDSNGVQELVSRRTFGSSWLGSHHVYDAAVLSGHSELVGEARSRIRMSEEWLRNWSKLSHEEREEESVSDEDRAVLAFAHFNVHGAEEAAYSLRRWRPRELSYAAGRILARRFLEHGRYEDLDALAIAAGNDLGLILAIAVETRSLHRLLPKAAAERAFKILTNRRVTVRDPKSANEVSLFAIAAMVETVIQYGICDASRARDLLERYLPEKPPHVLVSRFAGPRLGYVKAYALHGALADTPLQLAHLATDELRKEMDNEKRHSGDSQQLREFKEDIGALIPWCNLWARAVLGGVPKSELDRAIAGARAESMNAESSYSDKAHTSNEIAGVWIDILLNAGCADETAIRALSEWANSAKRQLHVPTLNHLARLTAKISGCEYFAFEFAQAAFSLLRDERSDAQYKAEGYVDISRSILTASQGEAEAYFDQAMEVASKIGDENLARWDALIYLAERAARPVRPSAEIAYKFARCAEVTRSYVDRDKHFAWIDTIKALTGLCPSSSLAIASRWRDRCFGRYGRVLAAVVESLVESRRLNALDAAAMVGFRADWDEIWLLEFALSACNREAKETVVGLIYRYMVLAGSSTVDKCRRLATITEREGLTLSGLETRISDAEAREAAQKENQTRQYAAAALDSAAEVRNWNAVFDRYDLTAADGILASYRQFRRGNPPFYAEDFFSEAAKRVPVGKEADFVRAFGDVAEFDLYSLRTLLESLPDNWKSRLSVRASLAETTKGFCQRHCMAVRRNKHYEVLPIEKACEFSGIDQAELIGVVLDAVGDSAELAGAERLFSLIGLLSGKLSNDEALDALSYGLDLFNGVLEESDGDGPWSESLVPPAPIEDALAGYIWAGLASPVAATRWEAAHVVVALCALGRTRVLTGLFNHAETRTSVPFADARLQFYGLHAQQWLMIAASRAASEYGFALAPHADQILACANQTQRHVLIRLFAARTALGLSAQGILDLQPEAHQQLAQINYSPLEPIALDPSEEYSNRPDRGKSPSGAEWKDQYLFGIDFGPYWLAPLGRCFGMGQSEIEQETLKVIRDELQYEGTHHRNEDERARLGVYDWHETRHSHGSYPSVDDQSFYLSYHAMMITAGHLLATRPLVKGKNDWEDNRFLDWIARHDLSREDGRWLADRRDARPVSRLICLGSNRAEWQTCISAEEFELALQPIPGYVTAWGHWSEIESSRKESVSISTALVSRQRSASLLRALQTTKNPYDFRIPSADDELEIERALYRLKGWIVDRQNDGRLDESDPWAGQVRFPAPEPAPFVIESMALSTDSDRRIWLSPSSKMPELQSEAWGDFAERNDSEQPSGSRLLASIHFLAEFLTRIDMDLIVEVQLQHRSRYERYGNRDSDEDVGDIPPSSRIFVIKSDRTIRGL